MTLGWSILLWAGIIWLVPLMYFLEKNECKPKKNIVVGVTLPYEGVDDPAVVAALDKFRRELKLVCWGALAVVIPCLFLPSFGVAMTAWLCWIVAVCFAFLVPYARCNRALRLVKAERGWRRPDGPQAVADLRAAAAELRWLSPWWFLPPFLLSLIPLALERELWWLWALNAALIPVFYGCYRFLYRNRAEVVDGDSGRTLALTRIRRYNWGKCWLILAWATGLFNLGLWLTLGYTWILMAVTLAYGLVVCGAVIRIELRVRRLQETLGNSPGGCVDEDDRWIWGLLYYNPSDRRMLVNARVGINATVNLARRPAQVLFGLALALLLACPLFGVWLIRLERAPVELAVTETGLTASHFSSEWSLSRAEIQSAELLDELPPLSRVAGTGLDSALTGTFRSEPWGRFTCCIDPRTGPWLLVTARDGTIYLFGASEPGGTEAVWAALEIGK